MLQTLRILKHPAFGWETVAECELCASHGDLDGCHECDGKGWRQLTEEEEMKVFDL